MKRLKAPVFAIVAAMLLVGAVLTHLRLQGQLQFLELAAYDLLVSTLPGWPENETDAVLVLVSEQDIQTLGNWPLTDRQLTGVMSALLAFDPVALGLDIYRDLPVSPGTEELQELFVRDPRIVAIEKFPIGDSIGIPPPPALRDTEQVGFSDLITDNGGIVRRNLLFQSNEERTGFSFSLRLALAFLAQRDIYPEAGDPDPSHMRLGEVNLVPLESSDGCYAVADAAGYQIMLGFRAPRSAIPRYTLQDIKDGRVGKRELEGKIVLIGVASESVKDYFATPFSTLDTETGLLSGTAIHAHAAQQLIDAALQGRKPLSYWTDSAELAWLWFWIALGFAAGWFAGSGWRFALIFSGGAVVCVLSAALAYQWGWWIPLVPNLIGWVLAVGISSALLAAHRRRDQKVLMSLFSRHVAPQVAETIWKRREEVLEGGRVRPQTLVVTTLFTDLQGFTALSEKMPPEPFFQWLNSYMARMTDVIMENGGVLDDYAGDGIKANFGVPINDPDNIDRDAAQALRCAMALGDALTALNREWKERGREPVAMRVGVHTGQVAVGTVGSRFRMKYTTVGSQVNLAARLESLGAYDPPKADDESCNCRILVSADTAKLVEDRFVMQDIGEYELKGIKHKTRIFHLTAACSKES